MTLDRDRPEILQSPEDPQACCTQLTITVPAEVAAKTRQKHDLPVRRLAPLRRPPHRAERGFATAKDPASNDTTRGWCRLMGLTPLNSGPTKCEPARCGPGRSRAWMQVSPVARGALGSFSYDRQNSI
jgi:hypothetical protein